MHIGHTVGDDWTIETGLRRMMALETGEETDVAEHPNLLLMRRALDAFRSGDVPTLAQVFARDVVWRVPGRSALAKDYKGQDEVFGFFGRLMELTNGTFRVESLDMFANDRGGVFVDRLSAARDGKTLDVRLLLHVSIRNGQIAEGVDCFHPEHTWDEFWS
ncbi:MAG TPA: nuclear transport factor 2 family protein [Vicinamibacterales bacterium]